MNSIFEWGSLILIAGTVAVGVGAILTSRTIQAKQEASIAQANTKAAEATKAAAEANERAAILDKKAAEARLELARIDPLNLPIRSIRADIFLTVRGDFYDWHFDTGPVLKGGARSVNISIVGKRGALVELQCNEFESFLRPRRKIRGRLMAGLSQCRVPGPQVIGLRHKTSISFGLIVITLQRQCWTRKWMRCLSRYHQRKMIQKSLPKYCSHRVSSQLTAPFAEASWFRSLL